MSAAVPSGPAPHSRPPGETNQELCLIESIYADLRALRIGLAVLLEEVAYCALHFGGRWLDFHQELTAAHYRAERALLTAASSDGVPEDVLEIGPRPPHEPPASEDEALARCRRVARDLEARSTCAISRTADVDLRHVSEALTRWRCELIGLEQPLIRLQAGAARRSR